jgi:hypothetical protein
VPASQISTVPAPYWPAGISPGEGRVFERVVLDVHREVALADLERDALRHGPARERPVALQAEVVVERPGLVALHDEDRLHALALLAAEGLGRLLPVALALVLAETGHEAEFARGCFAVTGAGSLSVPIWGVGS